MRETKFLAGLGTIFVFIGLYCFKAAFNKQTLKEEMRNVYSVPAKKYGKGFSIFSGIASTLLGLWLILVAIKRII
ncbi:MAG: hypothetical protein QM706_03230 [Nitrospira sp.]